MAPGSSDNTSVATVTASTGVVTGVAAGSATITYTVSNACGTASATKSITVNAAPNAGVISGPSSVCVGATIALATDGNSDGTWSSNNTSVATVIASTGVVKGIGAGSAIITYTFSNSCGSNSSNTTIQVNAAPNAGTISGTAPTCVGTSSTFASSGDAGGVWSSSNTNAATVYPSTGMVMAVGAGNVIIKYTVTTSCGTALASNRFTVVAAPVAGTVHGASTICAGSSTAFTTGGTSGGTWSSDNTSVATVTASTGVVTGVAAGSATITYTVSNACGSASATKSITVNVAPTAAIIGGGASNVCVGATTPAFTDATSGGTWSVTNGTGSATITSAGVLRGVSAGSVTVNYTITNTCGTATASYAVTINLTPVAGTISGTTPLCIGSNSTFTSSGTSGGAWGSSNTSVATVDASTGVVTGKIAGTTKITYTVTTSCGTVSTSKTITVQNCGSPAIAEQLPEPFSVTIMNNPSLIGTDFILWAKSNKDDPIRIIVVNMLGKEVFETKGITNQTYRFGAQFISGMYIVQVQHNNKVSTYKIIKGG